VFGSLIGGQISHLKSVGKVIVNNIYLTSTRWPSATFDSGLLAKCVWVLYETMWLSFVEAVSSCPLGTTRDHLLLRFMYYICTGNNVESDESSTDSNRLTPLEKGIVLLRSIEPICMHNVAELTGTVAVLIKQQVLLACYHRLTL